MDPKIESSEAEAGEQSRIESLIDDTLGLPKTTVEDVDNNGDVESDQKGGDEDVADDAGDISQSDSQIEAEKPPVTPPATNTAEGSDKNQDVPDLKYVFKDADGKEFTIKPGDNLDEVLAEFTPINNGQIMRILSEYNNLNGEASRLDAEARSKEIEAAEAAAAEERKQAQLDSWDNEIALLQESGILPTPKAKPGTAGWAKDPAVQKADAVFKFMSEENRLRLEKGLTPVTSFGTAFNLLNQREEAKAKEEAIKADNEAAKLKAELIGRGGSPANSAQAPYVAGQAKSIWEV